MTICYNAADVIVPTIESVLSQDYDNYEYIIEDGMSDDDTEKIVESYIEKFRSRGIKVIYNRKEDSGIYDAMNKGAGSANGDYVNFMNAGDCFYSPDVLGSVAKSLGGFEEPDIPEVVYGDCAVYEYGRFFLFQKSYDSIEEKMPFSHQSVFMKRGFLKDHPFNTSYRFSADYDLLLTAHKEGAAFFDSGVTVCIATADGLSSVNYHDTLMESADILKSHGVFHLSEKELSKTEKVLRIKQFVLDRFPVSVKKMIRDRQIRSRGQAFDPVIPPWFNK